MSSTRLLKSWFFRTVSAILMLSGSLKLIGLLLSPEIRLRSDPVTGVTFGTIFSFVGPAECLIGLWLLVGKSRSQAIVTAWIGTILLLYHVFGFSYKATPCPCLGTVTVRPILGINGVTMLSMAMSGYIFVGSWLHLITVRRDEEF